jgi:hypothetical protein
MLGRIISEDGNENHDEGDAFVLFAPCAVFSAAAGTTTTTFTSKIRPA